MMCQKCGRSMGWLILALGIGLLLADLNVWDFWGIAWSTLVFLVAGFSLIAKACCNECVSFGKKKTKK